MELMDVGAKELRENLAKYLEGVRTGEYRIRILRHDWVAAFVVSEEDIKQFMPHVLEGIENEAG